MLAQVGNARMLTMIGDGHTAYPANSACIDGAVEAYLKLGALPDVGTTCLQDVAFAQPQDVAAASGAGARAVRGAIRAGLRRNVRSH